ncbi:MAG TPA: hypothetical protein VK445_01875 [Dissulfurispiraceae bacterium]|nr:hypothetical protein [Dissulfurispiraceae bacterium]
MLKVRLIYPNILDTSYKRALIYMDKKIIKKDFLPLSLLAMVPVALVIIFLFYPAGTHKCKLCKFIAHIFLDDTMIAQGEEASHSMLHLHSMERVVDILNSHLAENSTFVFVLTALSECILILSVLASCRVSRAPPLNRCIKENQYLFN